MNIVIYALGGGWGHLARAAAITQALRPANVHILTNSPHAPVVQAALPELAIDMVTDRSEARAFVTGLPPMSESPSPPNSAPRQSRDRRERFTSPDILIIDTFPRGLGGELTSLPTNIRKVLIHRDLNPEYVRWAANLRDFVATQFELILCPGESGPFADLHQARFTPPWLVREPVPPKHPVQLVVCAAGNEDELPWYGETTALLSQNAGVRCIAPQLPPGCPPHLWIRHWPAIDYIASAQAVIGGAGYNTVHECLATGTPLIAKPWPRKYDRQRERAQRHESMVIVDTPAEAASAALHRLAHPVVSRPLLQNGAADAARWILTT